MADTNNYLVAIPILEKRESDAYYECGKLKIGKGWKYVGLGATILAFVGFLIYTYVHFAFK